MADVAFEATGETLEELLESAGNALTRSMVSNPESIETMESVGFTIEEHTEEKLLYKFLEEIVFYKDAEQLVFSRYNLSIERNDGLVLKATLQGERIDNDKHKMIVDVKAVSWHMFELKKEDGDWKAFVILDV